MRQNPEAKPEADTSSGLDQELEAMKQIAAALEPLDDGARERVVHWATDRFKVHTDK